jgi:hypothetical protein
MTRIDIDIPPMADLTDLDLAVEEAAARCGLRVALRGGLAQFPGAVHWHFKHGDERGTLEVTWWPREMQMWISVHDNRDAPWIEGCIDGFKTLLDARLQPSH